ncbi:alginate export family protein [Xanthomonas hyacinthi]
MAWPAVMTGLFLPFAAMAQENVQSRAERTPQAQAQAPAKDTALLRIGAPGPVPAPAGAPIPEPVPGGRKGPARTPQSLRWSEDWSSLKTASDRRPLEALRYLPLGDQAYLSIGGEVRYYYNYWEHLRLGASPDDRLDHLQQRLRLNADLHVGNNLRAFFEIGDDREFFARSVTPPNRDKLDVRQAFLDVRIPLKDGLSLTVRPGRFEMPLGNGKLIGMRDGTNVRFIYQGLRATLIDQGRFKLDGFSVKPVSYAPGRFDDSVQAGTHFNGLYGSVLLAPTSTLDAYYYDVARPLARYRDTSGKEVRRSYGTRLAIRAHGIDFDGEATYQDGSVGNQRIEAWGLLLEGGYTFAGSRLSPRLGARLNAFSGDGDRGDGKIGTFVPPFPRLPLYSDASWLNFSNLLDFYPTITLKPASRLTVSAGPELFWRQSRNDAVYFGPSTAPLLTPTDGKRLVGTNWNLQVDYVATRNLSFRLFATKFDASRSFKSGGGKSSNYFGYWAVFRF